MNKVVPFILFLTFSGLGLQAQTNTANQSHATYLNLNKGGKTESNPDGLAPGSVKWSVGPESMPGNLKAFQENKGQFIDSVNNWQVLYGAEYEGAKMLFTNHGVVYVLPERVEVDNKDIDKDNNAGDNTKEQKEEEHRKITVYHTITAEWENSNPNVTIDGNDETPYTFSSLDPYHMGKSFDNAKGFKTIVYHNIYPGIDIEYSFKEGEGIQSAIKVAPGFDASVLKVFYDRHSGLSLNKDGDLLIGTPLGNIVNHAPLSQNGTSLKSCYQINGNNEVQYNIMKGSPGSGVIIYPWVVSPTTANFLPSNVEIDGANNSYIMGMDAAGGMKVQKYTSAGALSWTYSLTQLSTPDFVSDLAVNKTGVSYIPMAYPTTNSVGNYYAMVSLTTAGTLNYFYNTDPTPFGQIFEVWNVAYSCTYSQLIQAGAPTAEEEDIGVVNGATGVVGPVTINASYGEIYAGCIAPNGNYYAIAANPCFGCSTPGDDIVCYTLAAGTAAFSWNIQSTYQWNDYDSKNPNGIATNGIAAGCAYLYTYDGKTLNQRSLTTGAVINTKTVTGGNATLSSAPSGVAVDLACGYVYVGSANSNVYVFDQTLNAVTTLAASGEVYDVCFNNGVVDACGGSGTGSGFLTQYVAQTCVNELVITHTNTSCGNNNGTAQVATPTFCSAPYSYLWTPGNLTSQNITGLASGIYTVNVGTSTSCVTTSDTVTISASAPINVTLTPTNGCTGSISTVVTGGVTPYTFLWSSGQTTSNISGIASGSYTLTVTDASGTCSQTANTTISGASLTLTPSQTNVSCNGGSNGSATITPSGGTAPYTYAWGGSQTTSAITGLIAGTYSCTVKESTGCSGVVNFTITQPTAITADSSAVGTICGAADGSASIINVAGGTGPYTYLWNTGQTGSNLTAITAGTYTDTIKDADGCKMPITVIVPNSGGPRDSIVGTINEKCFGGATGSAWVGVKNGTAPYTYSWAAGGQTGDTATGLIAGVYTVTVKDAGGCSTTAIATITQPLQLRDSISATTNILCFGTNNGSMTVGVKYGTPTYTYSWAPGGQTNNPATNLAAGPYTVTVTDANGCSNTATGTITQPTALALTANSFSVTCNGACNGQLVSIVTTGSGTAPYKYLWSNGATSAGITGICPGTYSLQVTDANGCVKDTTGLIITQPTAITGTTTTATSHCSQADGGACITAAGGTLGYTYLWNNATNSTCITNVMPGNYSVIITDANKCNDTVKVTVPNLPGDTAVITATTNVSCNGGNNGTATAGGKGSNPPFTYLWTPSAQATQTSTGLKAGNYTVTVTDAVGCTSTAVATITQPAVVVATIPTPAAICIGQSATLTASAIGGTPGYTFTWSTGVTAASITVSPITTTSYTVSVVDVNGCSTKDSVTVTVHPPLSVVVSPNKALCPGGSTTLTATAKGGNGTYTYTWLPTAGLNPTTGPSVTCTPNATTEYTVLVNDGCGTPSVSDSLLIIVDPLPKVSFTADTLNGCTPLCIQFTNNTTVIGGGPISYAWEYGDGGSYFKKDSIYCYQHSGIYTVGLVATSDSGCIDSLVKPNYITAYSHPIAAYTFNPQPAYILNPTINFVDESTDAYGIKNWLWDFNDPADGSSTKTSPTYTFADTGTYCPMLYVTNIHNCIDSVQHCVIISPYFTFYIPNAFTPNGDGLNETFAPKGTYICNFKMYIYDRWGQQLYYTNLMSQGWNGVVQGGNTMAQEDTYIYLIEVTDCVEHKLHQYLGRVSLIK